MTSVPPASARHQGRTRCCFSTWRRSSPLPVQRWTKVDGERQATTKQQAVRPWWKTDATGQVVMSVKFGAKPIEFEKGKAGIVVPSKDKLPAVIDTLISAVRPGSRDQLRSA